MPFDVFSPPNFIRLCQKLTSVMSGNVLNYSARKNNFQRLSFFDGISNADKSNKKYLHIFKHFHLCFPMLILFYSIHLDLGKRFFPRSLHARLSAE